ncbi:hypothetical protein [Aureimonas psammosilenae]|uniref:hypothetical protein n=1 Tax=Aureimonas psammosilenae TaxID=2495496 RepID=UPI0012607E8D|nr:hypothetical protein [Aureimonas psammosilenae]
MVEAITEHRAWLKAYGAAPFDGRSEEEMWLEANPDDAGERLHQMPPMPTTKAGAVAAIRFVMEDRDYIQASHARILKQALAYLEGGAV